MEKAVEKRGLAAQWGRRTGNLVSTFFAVYLFALVLMLMLVGFRVDGSPLFSRLDQAYLSFEDRCEFQGERFGKVNSSPGLDGAIGTVVEASDNPGVCRSSLYAGRLYTPAGQELTGSFYNGLLAGTTWVPYHPPTNPVAKGAIEIVQVAMSLVILAPVIAGFALWWWWARPLLGRLAHWVGARQRPLVRPVQEMTEW